MMTLDEKEVIIKFLKKHEECDKASTYVWLIAANHGMEYRGPNYSKELLDLKKLVETKVCPSAEKELYDKWEQHCHQCGADNPKHLPRTEGGKAFYDTDRVGKTYWIRCGYEGCYWEAHARHPT